MKDATRMDRVRRFIGTPNQGRELGLKRRKKTWETFAECQLTRQGNRVANVMITAWQKSRSQPIATARAHFLLED